MTVQQREALRTERHAPQDLLYRARVSAFGPRRVCSLSVAAVENATSSSRDSPACAEDGGAVENATAMPNPWTFAQLFDRLRDDVGSRRRHGTAQGGRPVAEGSCRAGDVVGGAARDRWSRRSAMPPGSTSYASIAPARYGQVIFSVRVPHLARARVSGDIGGRSLISGDGPVASSMLEARNKNGTYQRVDRRPSPRACWALQARTPLTAPPFRPSAASSSARRRRTGSGRRRRRLPGGWR